MTPQKTHFKVNSTLVLELTQTRLCAQKYQSPNQMPSVFLPLLLSGMEPISQRGRK